MINHTSIKRIYSTSYGLDGNDGGGNPAVGGQMTVADATT